MRINLRHFFSKILSPFKFYIYKAFYYHINITSTTTPRIYGYLKIFGEKGSLKFGSNLQIINLDIVYGNIDSSFFECGNNCILGNNLIIAPRLGKIIIGNNVFIGANALIQAWVNGNISIGNDVMIANGTNIFASNHIIEDPYAGYKNEKGADIIIDKNVWIGAYSIILPGVKIGESSVVGAGSIVNKNIPPFTMWAGNPAKMIKRFNQQSKLWERV